MSTHMPVFSIIAYSFRLQYTPANRALMLKKLFSAGSIITAYFIIIFLQTAFVITVYPSCAGNMIQKNLVLKLSKFYGIFLKYIQPA